MNIRKQHSMHNHWIRRLTKVKKYHTDFIISFFSSSSFFRLATLKLWLLLTSEWWLSEFDLLFSLCCFGMMGSNTLASCQWNKLWMHIWTREPTVCIQTIYISVMIMAMMIMMNLHAANIQKQTRRLVWILFFVFLKLNRKWGECYPLVSDCKEQIKLIYHLKRKLWPINLPPHRKRITYTKSTFLEVLPNGARHFFIFIYHLSTKQWKMNIWLINKLIKKKTLVVKQFENCNPRHSCAIKWK